MAIANLDDHIAAMPGQCFGFTKSSISSGVGNFISTFFGAGQPGAAAAIGNTTTGLIPTDATPGAFPFTNPGGAGLSYLGKFWISAHNITGEITLYDRLWHAGAFTSSNGTINATDSTPIDRDSTGNDTELWCEIATALSATATTLTATYTDQNGTGSQSATCAVPASAIQYRMFPFVLQGTDNGIRSVENLAGSAAPTGTFNLVILRRIARVPIASLSVAGGGDFFKWGGARIYDNACLAMMMLCNSTSTGDLSGQLAIIQG